MKQLFYTMLLLFCFTSCKQTSKPVVEEEEQDPLKEFVNIDTIHHFKEGDDVKLPVILYAEDKVYGWYFVPMFLYKDGRVIYYKKANGRQVFNVKMSRRMIHYADNVIKDYQQFKKKNGSNKLLNS